MILPVKRIENRGRFGEYPALRNVKTGQVYVDTTLGMPRFLTQNEQGLNRSGEFVGFNIPGAWTTWNGWEPDCPIKAECVFDLEERKSAE